MRYAFLLLTALAAISCASMEANAKKDPLKCERDPKCGSKDGADDCSRQCSDDPACVDRCAEINQQTGASQR